MVEEFAEPPGIGTFVEDLLLPNRVAIPRRVHH